MAALASAWQHQFVETNSIRLHCVTQGQGELVVLLHGFWEFWYSWRYQIPALANYFQVVVPDLRGHNDSDKPGGGYDLDTLCTDIRGLIDAFGHTRAHVVGHDFGGAIAWRFAERFPQVVDRLVVLNAPHPRRFVQDLGRNLDHLLRSWYVLVAQVPGVPEWVLRENMGLVVQNLFRGQAVRKRAFTAEIEGLYQAALEKPGVLGAMAQAARQLLSPQLVFQDWFPLPNPIASPTLVLWGEDDQFLSRQLTEGLELLVKAPLQLKFVANCGHWIQQEVPQTVNRELLRFLQAV